MQMKRITLLTLSLLAVATLVMQVTTVSAKDKDHDKDDHKPMTSPVTSMMTSFKLGGKVLFSFHNRFSPFANEVVRAINNKTHQIFFTNTDSSGVYQFTLAKGVYVVEPKDTSYYSFSGHAKTVHLDKNITDVNFYLPKKDDDKHWFRFW